MAGRLHHARRDRDHGAIVEGAIEFEGSRLVEHLPYEELPDGSQRAMCDLHGCSSCNS